MKQTKRTSQIIQTQKKDIPQNTDKHNTKHAKKTNKTKETNTKEKHKRYTIGKQTT